MGYSSEDGIDHINLSFGGTELGNYLSTLYKCRITTKDGMFNSIEGYIYFLLSKNNKFKDLSGWKCKALGKKLVKFPKEFPKEIIQPVKEAIADKMIFGKMADEIKESTLPFKLYYNFSGKEYTPQNLQWIVQITEFVRKYLKEDWDF